MEVERFSELVDEALASIPDYFRSRFANISLEVMPLAPAPLAAQVGKHPWSLLGLYTGIPYGKRGPWYGNVLPDRILIFQSPIERIASTDAAIRNKVRQVVIHEVGHYFGLTDEELHRLERESRESEESTRPPAG